MSASKDPSALSTAQTRPPSTVKPVTAVPPDTVLRPASRLPGRRPCRGLAPLPSAKSSRSITVTCSPRRRDLRRLPARYSRTHHHGAPYTRGDQSSTPAASSRSAVAAPPSRRCPARATRLSGDVDEFADPVGEPQASQDVLEERSKTTDRSPSTVFILRACRRCGHACDVAASDALHRRSKVHRRRLAEHSVAHRQVVRKSTRVGAWGASVSRRS